jgi:hypothetical protein
MQYKSLQHGTDRAYIRHHEDADDSGDLTARLPVTPPDKARPAQPSEGTNDGTTPEDSATTSVGDHLLDRLIHHWSSAWGKTGWMIAAFFTAGFCHLRWWQAVLAVAIWPYYAGDAVATRVDHTVACRDAAIVTTPAASRNSCVTPNLPDAPDRPDRPDHDATRSDDLSPGPTQVNP